MRKPIHIIYITGLGDQNAGGQKRAVKTWRLWGVHPELFQVMWADKEPWQPKFDRLLARIDELDAAGKTVAVVGASAGASAVINVFAARKDVLAGVVCIAGKVNHPDAIGGRYRSENPAFITSAKDSVAALASLDADDRQRILSRFALFDPIVPRKDSIIPGANNRRLWSVGHLFTIATQITLGAPGFLRFLKRLTRQKSA